MSATSDEVRSDAVQGSRKLMVLLAPMQKDIVKKHPAGPPLAAPKP